MYKIADLQIPGRYFADGSKYKTKSDIVEQLLSYHDIDFSGTDDKNNELDIWDYLVFWKIKTTKERLDWVLEYGQWAIEKVEKKRKNNEK